MLREYLQTFAWKNTCKGGVFRNVSMETGTAYSMQTYSQCPNVMINFGDQYFPNGQVY